jgi:ppGpp synthetase/RelA/SpoT-type nucleotidyltranferase
VAAPISWQAIRESDVLRHADDRSAWIRLYDELRPAINFVETLLKFELAGFETQSGRDRLAFSTLRAKTAESFADKMAAMGRDERRLKSHFDNSPTRVLSIFDLVSDLIGGRLVFYFERDIQDAVLFWMSFPMYQPIEVTHWEQDVSGYDTAIPAAARWIRLLPGNLAREAKPPKRSGYESLHFVLSMNVGLLAARCEVAQRRPDTLDNPMKQALVDAWGGVSVELRKMLGEFTLEIQCRTILEHTWAEVEHRARYSLAKGRRPVAPGPGDDVRTFRNYKAILRAAQIFQNSIKYGFSRWDEGDFALSGRSTSLELGERAKYFSADEKALLDRFIAVLTDALREDRRHDEAAWTEVFEAYVQTVRTMDFEKRLDLSPDLELEEYCRRRLLIMLLGFILAYGPSGRDVPGKSVRSKAAELYFLHNLDDKSKPWVSPSVAAVRIYEHLKLLDAFHSKDDPERLCFDPLVEARAASVYFRHFGSLRRSSALLEEAVSRVPQWKAVMKETALLLSPKYLKHRLAENYWAAYNLEGRSADDLQRAIDESREVLEQRAPEGHKKKTREIDQRSVAHVWTLTLHKAIGSLAYSADSSAELRWHALQRTWKETRDLGKHLKLLENPQTFADSSLRLQGYAISLAARASQEAKDGCDQSLILARKAVRQARRNIKTKNEDRRGGALPFHVEVARDMEEFIFSLSSEDKGRRRKTR